MKVPRSVAFNNPKVSNNIQEKMSSSQNHTPDSCIKFLRSLTGVLVLYIFFLQGLSAQYLIIKEVNSGRKTIALTQIRKISFTNGNLQVSLIQGTLEEYALNSIQSLLFRENLPSVTFSAPFNETGFTLFPNPSTGPLNLYYNSNYSATMRMQIIDSRGRFLIQEQFNFSEGNNHKIIDISELPDGLYFCRLLQNGESAAIRFIKQ